MAKRVALLTATAATMFVGGWWLALDQGAPASPPRTPGGPTKVAPDGPGAAGDAHVEPAAVEGWDEPLRYVAIGGGADPESTEVSLEQDMKLVARVLTGPGTLHFGGGEAGRPVRVLDEALSEPDLLSRLGEVFQPRLGRRSAYRQSTLASRAAGLDDVEATLSRALRLGSEPLLVYVASHGEQGAEAADNYVMLWGGRGLSVRRLAELHDAGARPLRLVVASCFSGGFAELAFTGADAARGPTDAPRCGLFAGTWDRQTSGCDPDPDRRNHEGYSLHFLSALEGRDRAGQELPVGSLDLDGDGRVGLLDAHTRAVIASRSIDVPTTTSQRLLRFLDRGRARPDPELLPEEARVVEVLGAELGLHDAAATERRWRDLDAELAVLDARLADADTALDDATATLAMQLLSRWPVLDDPYHPRFRGLLDTQAAAISEVLDRSPAARAFASARARVGALEQELWDRQVVEARVLRLVRSYETLERAAALRVRGGAEWERYSALLACERWAPPR